MRRGKHAPDGGSEAVHRPQAGVGEGQAAKQARQRHVFARRGIGPIMKRDTQRAPGAAQALGTETVGEGIRAARDKWLDELREGVEAGAGGERGRQAGGEPGIDEGQPRQQERTAQADLEPVGGRQEHGIARDLGARAGGGGNGNTGRGGLREGMRPADDFEKVEEFAGVGEQRGNGLGRVERAATAETDDELAPGGARLRDGGHDRLGCRLAVQGERRGGDALGGEQVEQLFSPGRVAAGHHEGAAAEGAGGGAGFTERAGPEDDPGSGREFEPHDGVHQSASAGNTLANFTLERGSAIIGATASRQAR